MMTPVLLHYHTYRSAYANVSNLKYPLHALMPILTKWITVKPDFRTLLGDNKFVIQQISVTIFQSFCRRKIPLPLTLCR